MPYTPIGQWDDLFQNFEHFLDVGVKDGVFSMYCTRCDLVLPRNSDIDGIQMHFCGQDIKQEEEFEIEF